MPATESTWRNTTLLHRIFAISGVVLTLATVWMFYKDHSRPWKDIQPQVVNIDLNMNKWRQEQFDTTEAVLAHDRLSHAATAAKSQPILMTISLGGAPGDNTGGKVSAGARPVEEVAPKPKGPEPIPPAPPPKSAPMTVPTKPSSVADR